MASTLPPQPDESTWQFVDELRTASVHAPVKWTRRKAAVDEAHFPGGFVLDVSFPDPQCLLATAYADFGVFQESVGLAPSSGNAKRLVLLYAPTEVREQYTVTVTRDLCQLSAGDTEGIRRGLIFIEDEMLRRGGPFLPLGRITRKPWVRTRISRCFYGPINRPPKLRDELTDTVDYYPDEYLNRLAHEGVNVLWLTVNWYELIPSRIIPEYGRNAGPRLDKLRRTVAKCARYGIRIYPFCIEPAGFTRNAPEVQAAAEAHAELLGHNRAFCTSTETGRAYVEEAVRTLFEEVPDLGGMIVIPVGERQTHCYSAGIPDGGSWPTPNTCPRCSKRRPWEVLADTLSAMRRGMDQARPEAELVAWPYGQFIGWGAEKTVEAAGHIPPGVILQHNFETGGANQQLGKSRPTWDYWLSYVGPSEVFRRAAEAARDNGTRTSAKLQVGCSHEVATTQVVPVPGLLHRKYRAMRELGVSSAMHSWYFGTYPSLMTRAAGELSFEPFPRSEGQFLLALAKRDWGDHAETVAEAWRWFARGYSNYPTSHIFGYFGPMHDGPAWPMYLEPRRLPLAPTWQIGYAPSGDYVADCVTNGFTLNEIVTLCRRMTEYWDRGLALLAPLKRKFADQPERLRDIGLATALGLQFRSGYQLLRFYQLRERLADAKSPDAKAKLLAEMKVLVQSEIKVSQELLPLAEADSRLGFHSEAEGYKYHPALLRWRIEQLRELLAEEFPRVEAQAKAPGQLWPDYTGMAPTGPAYRAGKVDTAPTEVDWNAAPLAACTHWLRHVYNAERWRKCGYDPNDHLTVDEEEKAGRTTTWQALLTAEGIRFRIACKGAGNSVQIYIEPARTQPRRIFSISADGAARCQQDDGYIPREHEGWEVETQACSDGWTATVTLPWEVLGAKAARRPKPLRVNVIRQLPIDSAPGVAACSWALREPVKGRLVWGDLNPATDFGWLQFG
ncbi:MAG: hypothetical protein HPY44_13045 [Armatimonadetes bacterium]|nr:hypothetical protein [Armatimonadota bacterium]